MRKWMLVLALLGACGDNGGGADAGLDAALVDSGPRSDAQRVRPGPIEPRCVLGEMVCVDADSSVANEYEPVCPVTVEDGAAAQWWVCPDSLDRGLCRYQLEGAPDYFEEPGHCEPR